jgi:hypothetical protein
MSRLLKMLDDADRAHELFKELEQAGVLEDRLEYTLEDLALSNPGETKGAIARLAEVIRLWGQQ